MNGTTDLCDRNWSKLLSNPQINVLRLLIDEKIFRYINQRQWVSRYKARFKNTTIESLISWGLVRIITREGNFKNHFNRQELVITGKGKDVLYLIQEAA